MEKLYGWGLPADISTHGASIDRLIVLIHGIMLVLFVGWSIFIVTALVRFRARPGHRASSEGGHFKLPTYLEVAIVVVEFALLFAFSIPLTQRIKAIPRDKNAFHVRVVAEQFAWNIQYPGPDGRFGRSDPKLMGPANPLGLDPDDPAGKDDISTINQLHIPVDTPIWVDLSSKDVIHCFSIPVMRVKQDVIPGQLIPVGFQATRTGDFQIACAQLCGLGHYRMMGYFVVDSKEKFQSWLGEQAAKKTA